MTPAIITTPNSAVHADAMRLLSDWKPGALEQDALRHAFLGFLAARPDSCARSCVPGHLTASAIVLSHDGTHVLLTLHPRIGRWVQLGGHCEEHDAGLAAAALREGIEESGIPDLRIDSQPLHLDVHPITCSLGTPTRHFDVRFLLHAPPDATPVRSAESADLAWWPMHALPPDIIPAVTARAHSPMTATSGDRARASARQQALTAHFERFPADRPRLAAVALRRVAGTGHPAERHPDVVEAVAEWIESREPDWMILAADETMDQVLDHVEMIVARSVARGAGA